MILVQTYIVFCTRITICTHAAAMPMTLPPRIDDPGTRTDLFVFVLGLPRIYMMPQWNCCQEVMVLVREADYRVFVPGLLLVYYDAAMEQPPRSDGSGTKIHPVSYQDYHLPQWHEMLVF